MAFSKMQSGYHVANAVANTGAKWARDWIAEAERQFGIPPHSLPVPERGQWVLSPEQFEKWPEDQTPVVLVMVPGLAGDPRREADRTLTAPVAVALGILVSTGHGPDANRETAEVLAAALSTLFLRHPVEGIETAGIEYGDERWGEVPGSSERTLGAARVIFRLWVKNWRELRGGPPSQDPSPDPYIPPTPVDTTPWSPFPTISKGVD